MEGEAGTRFAESLRLFELSDARVEAARARVVWGKLLQARGSADKAREHFQKAAVQFEASGAAARIGTGPGAHGGLNSKMNLDTQLAQLENARHVRRLPDEELTYFFKHALTLKRRHMNRSCIGHVPRWLAPPAPVRVSLPVVV